MKRSIEISHGELIELLKKTLNVSTPSQSIELTAQVHLHDDNVTDIRAITIAWDEGVSRDSNTWDR